MFMTKNVATHEGWSEVDMRFDQLAADDGTPPKLRFAQCIRETMTKKCSELQTNAVYIVGNVALYCFMDSILGFVSFAFLHFGYHMKDQKRLILMIYDDDGDDDDDWEKFDFTLKDRVKFDIILKEALEWPDNNQNADVEDFDDKFNEVVKALWNPNNIKQVYEKSGANSAAADSLDEEPNY
ncbi:hypothetical protein QYF36_024022 [Acer negundo]|nr:hypothetical protein QYF36_024022 [Acer negundo]